MSNLAIRSPIEASDATDQGRLLLGRSGDTKTAPTFCCDVFPSHVSFAKLPSRSDLEAKLCDGSHKQSKHCKKLPRLSWFTFSKIQISVRFMLRESPSCKRTSSLQGGFAAYGVASAEITKDYRSMGLLTVTEPPW